MKKYKTFIFDLDGTLLSTLEDLAGSVNFALKNNGYPERTKEEVRMFVGNGIRLLIERAVPKGIETEKVDKVFADFKEYYANHLVVETKPYEGIMKVLCEFKEHDISMAIVSNKFDQGVKDLCKQFFDGYIEVAIGESADVRKKPAPDSVFKAIEELGIDKSTAVYVGDSDVDIKTAHASGLDIVSVTWGFRDRDFLVKNGGEEIIDKPEELLKYADI